MSSAIRSRAAPLLAAVALAATATALAQDEMSFGDDDEAPPAQDDTMSFGDEDDTLDFDTPPDGAASGPTAPPVERPGPAAEELDVPAPLEVRVAARRVVAGQIRLVPIEITAPASTRSLRGYASSGEIERIESSEPGKFTTTLRLPAVRAPRVILLVFAGNGTAGAVRVPVSFATDLEVRAAEPGASVTVEIAGETFGPVRAVGRNATVPVVVPPGTLRGTVTSRGREATGTESIELPSEPLVPMMIAPADETFVADDGPVIPILVAASDERGGVPETWSLSVETGALGEPAEIQPGLRVFPWRRSRALGEFAFVLETAAGSYRRPVRMTAGPPVGVEVVAEPETVPADGNTTVVVFAGLSDGLGHFIESGPVDIQVEGGQLLGPPSQVGGMVVLSLAADAMSPDGQPPPAIVVSARAGGRDGVGAVRQYDPSGLRLRLRADPATLPADGTSEATIRLEVTDAFDEALPVTANASLSALQGTVPATVEVRHGTAEFPFRAGRQAGGAMVRAELGGAVAHTAIQLSAGTAGRLDLDIRPAEGDPNAYHLRARLLDESGNGLPPGEIVFSATATQGAAASPFEPEPVADEAVVGWMTALLHVLPGTTEPVDVEVRAGDLTATGRIDRTGTPVLYVGLAGGYAHNLGAAGLGSVRASFGWLDAFGVAGLTLGLELGYGYLGLEGEDDIGAAYPVEGHAVAALLTFGYRRRFGRWIGLWSAVGLGMQAGWFDVAVGSSTTSAEGLVAFALALRVGIDLFVGPGAFNLQLAYDDARFQDVVAGNVGGLGFLAGYRLEI